MPYYISRLAKFLGCEIALSAVCTFFLRYFHASKSVSFVAMLILLILLCGIMFLGCHRLLIDLGGNLYYYFRVNAAVVLTIAVLNIGISLIDVEIISKIYTYLFLPFKTFWIMFGMPKAISAAICDLILLCIMFIEPLVFVTKE